MERKSIERMEHWLIGSICVVGLVCLALAGYVLWAWPAPTYDALGGWSTPGWLIALGLAGYGLGMLVLAFFATRSVMDCRQRRANRRGGPR
jgi:uncharacterized membrane protein